MSGTVLLSGCDHSLSQALCPFLDTLGSVQPMASVKSAEAWEAACDSAGSLTGVVNGLSLAGVPSRPIANTGFDAFDSAFLATIGQTYAAIKASVPRILASGGGFFLTILDIDESDANGILAPTIIGGLTMLTRASAAEFAAPPSVRINLIVRDRQLDDLIGTAGLAAYLCGPQSAYVTGAVMGRADAK